MVAWNNDFLCIFDDQHSILVLKQKSDKARLEQVADKIILYEDELALRELADQMLNVSGLTSARLPMQ